MNIAESTINGIKVLSLEGVLNAASSPKFKAYLETADHSGPMIINLEQVEFIDSSGLGLLVRLARQKKSANEALKLAKMNDRVKRVFEITQAHSLFDIYDDIQAAAGN